MTLPFEVPPTWKSFHAEVDELQAVPFGGADGYAGSNPVWWWFGTMGGMRDGLGAGSCVNIGCPYGNQYGGGGSQGDIR